MTNVTVGTAVLAADVTTRQRELCEEWQSAVRNGERPMARAILDALDDTDATMTMLRATVKP